MRDVKKGNPAATVGILSLLPYPCQNPICNIALATNFIITVHVHVQVHLQYDKLYVDGKCFVWNDHRGKVSKIKRI